MSGQVEQLAQGQESGKAEEAKGDVDVNEMMARLEKLESSNSRLLEESRTWKSRYQQTKAEIEQEKTQKMEQSNDFKGLYEKAQQELAAANQAREDEKKESLRATLKYEVAKNAKDAEDVDLLIAAITSKQGSLAYDKENRHWEGVESVIGEIRKEKPFLFNRERVGLANGRPSNEAPKEKSAREKLAEDPNAMLNELLKSFV